MRVRGSSSVERSRTSLCFLFAVICVLIAIRGHAASLRFDTSDFIVLPENIAPANITIEAWFRLSDTSDPNWIPIIDKETGSGQAADFAWRLGVETQRPDRAPLGSLVLQISNLTYTAVVHSSTIPSTGVWYHVAGTYDGLTLRIYVNGVLEGEGTTIFAPPAGAVWQGGDLPQYNMPTAIARFSNGPLQYFHGNVDELRIWNYARSGADIAATKSLRVDENSAGLVAYWDFEQGADSSILYDKTSRSFHGTIHGAEWVTDNAPLDPPGKPTAVILGPTTPVAVFQTIQFDGSSSYHDDSWRKLVLYEWDFSFDGVEFAPEATGIGVSKTALAVGKHRVALRVTDDYQTPQSDMAEMSFYVDSNLGNGFFEMGRPYPVSWHRSGLGLNDVADCTVRQEGECSFRMIGRSNSNKRLVQRVKMAGEKGGRITVGGWSRASLPSPTGGFYGLRLRVHSQDGSLVDYQVPFRKRSHNWEHAANVLVTRKDFDYLEIYLEFDNQTGQAWFDAVRLDVEPRF